MSPLYELCGHRFCSLFAFIEPVYMVRCIIYTRHCDVLSFLDLTITKTASSADTGGRSADTVATQLLTC